MQRTVFQSSDPPFLWLDVTAPTPEELHALAARYELHATAVLDCLDPEHLPKYEKFGETNFLILRVHDYAAPARAGTIQELTRKIAIFSRPGLMLTIHRSDLPMVVALRERFGGGSPEAECSAQTLLAALVNASLDSYEKPLQHAEDALDEFETGLFRPEVRTPALERIHALKRTIGLIRRILWQTQGVLQRLSPSGEPMQPHLQDLKENAESYHFWSDQLYEAVTNLQGMHVAMASHRTNEVMRVLTLFSVFFLPLTFVVGIYGMNFKYMPELGQRWAYPALLAVLAGICLGIFWWFRQRGWLGKGDS
jgi:magnesium transporter